MAMRFVNLRRIAHYLLFGPEEEDFVVSHGKVDVALGVVVHGEPKIRSHNALPILIVLLAKFLFHIQCYSLKKKAMYQHSEVHNQLNNQANNFSVLTYILIFILHECKCCTIHSILLHFVRHVNSFDNGFVSRHLA